MIGITSVIDLEEQREAGSEYKRVAQMCVKEVFVTFLEEPLEDALRKMDQYHVGRLPVVQGEGADERNELIGIIGRSDIIREHFRRWAYLRGS
jgi:predicted transcriptional regulator